MDPLFDREFYSARYPDVRQSGIDPAAHFLLFGARERRSPHPMFDTAYYLAANPDVAASGQNAVLHFLSEGWKQYRRPNPLFDPRWYAAQYALGPNVNPLLDYIRRRAAGEAVLPRPPLREFLLEQPLPPDAAPSGSFAHDIGIALSEFRGFAISAARLKRCGRAVILAISHALGGGVAEYDRRLREALFGKAELLLLTPSGNLAILACMNPEYRFSLAIDPQDDYQGLLGALRLCGVTRLHLQHLHGHHPNIHRLHRDLGVPFDFTVHDYFTVCPQVHLNNIHGCYCGEPDEAGCNACLSARPSYSPRSIQEWRRDHGWVLRDASRVIAPSLDAAQRVQRYAPGRQILLAAHPDYAEAVKERDAPSLGGHDPLRIAVLGMLGPYKGLALVRECARLARQRKLELDFTLIGHTDKILRSIKEPFRQTGRYESTALPALLTHADPHLVWFPSQVPETYCYALSSALEAGLPVAVTDLGALPERVRGLSWAWIIPPFLEPGSMIDFLLEIRERNFLPHLSPPPPSGRSGAPHGFYDTEYLRPASPPV